MITRIYFEADDLQPFIAWLKTQPPGVCHVLIGTDHADFKTVKLMEAVTAESRGLAASLLFMLQSGMMQIKVSEKVDLPVGVPLETKTRP